MKRTILLLSCLFAIISLASAQVSKVSGLVIAKEDGLPIIGASVVVDGDESISAITDHSGKFVLTNVPSSAKTLTVSFIGMKTTKVSIAPEVEVQLKKQSKVLEYGKNSVIVGYNNMYTKESDAIYNETFSGFSLGYNHMFDIFKNKPLYLEAGALFQYHSKRFAWNESYKEKFKYAKINVPISLVYVYNIGSSDFSILPKAGINASFNILLENEYKDYEYDEFEVIDFFDTPGIDTKRFTYGWHIGADFAYKNYILGFTYSADINKFVQTNDSADPEVFKIGYHVKTATLNITFAYRF